MIHNGIIENYHQLTADFELEGKLISQTDTEVAARVLDALYDGDPLASLRRFQPLLKGSYSFCILFSDHPGEIYALRNVSPLVAAYTHSGSIVASDLTALIPYTKKYVVVPEDRVVKMTPYRMAFYDENGHEIQPEILEVNWDTDAAMKNGFPHFMLKEIHEQPDAMKNTILPRLTRGLPDFSEDGIPDQIFADCSQIRIVACGTAMHAGMVARAIMEPLLRIPLLVGGQQPCNVGTPHVGKSVHKPLCADYSARHQPLTCCYNVEDYVFLHFSTHIVVIYHAEYERQKVCCGCVVAVEGTVGIEHETRHLACATLYGKKFLVECFFHAGCFSCISGSFSIL